MDAGENALAERAKKDSEDDNPIITEVLGYRLQSLTSMTSSGDNG